MDSLHNGDRFVGAGLAFPLRLDPVGSVALVSRDTDIEEAIHLILATRPGERPMRPEFGCGIHSFLFAPADAGTAGLMAEEVRRALTRWEPRITLERVDVTVDPNMRNCMRIAVEYAIRATNDHRNLVVPFYVIPEERT
jgi:phage baseplate assembly protein W